MKAQVGQYKFGRHRNHWGIWQYNWVSETGTSATFIKDVFTYEEAVREVYRLNGWGEPKYINRRYKPIIYKTMANLMIITDSTATRMNVVAQRTQNLLVAGAKAMLIEQLKEKLRGGVARFIFIKKNGEVREAFGTTNAAVAAKYTNGNGISREYFKTTAFFDIEKGEWRSFRWESIVKVF